MVTLCQQDIRWNRIQLLPSNLKMGRFGCTTTCICMLSDYFGCFETPDRVVNHNIFYNAEGKILWTKINFSKFKFVNRFYSRDDVAINESLKNLDKACILAINADSHWVVALKRFGKYIWIADPFDGKKKFINQKIVSGSAHFIRK